MNYSILSYTIIILSLVLIISLIFRHLSLPQILGYLVVGAVVGPHGLGWIKNVSDAHQFAGFGVVFLMFMIGLEFSSAHMYALRKSVFFLGSAQVIICSLLSLAIGVVGLGLPWHTAFIIGGILAMSSTAITIKQLSEQLELFNLHGQNAVGILLFQDLAVIPFFILIGSLGKLGAHQSTVVFTLLFAILKGILATIIILTLGKQLFRRLFQTIAATRLIELFTLAALLVTLASAWLTHNLGLSYALGAFLAGMILSETQFRHQIAVEIRPFRDVLLGLFFITIGMLLNMTSWRENWLWILLLFSGLVISKIVIITLLSLWAGSPKYTAFRTGLVLAQGGEFSFALLTLALTNQLFPPGYGQVILGALLLSFGLAPLLITYNRQIARFVFPKTTDISHAEATKKLAEQVCAMKDHVIICGYGPISQNIATLLEQEKIAYIVLDLDAEHIREAALAGKPVSYGDATHPGLLNAAGISNARALVIGFDNPHAAMKVLQYVNNTHPQLPTLVRCKDELELAQLEGVRTSQIVVESHEESLSLIYHLLHILHVPQAKIVHLIEEIRKKHNEMLRQSFPGTFTEESTEEGIPLKQLRPLVLLPNTYVVRHTLGETIGRLHDTEVIAIRRGNDYHSHPRSQFKPEADDVVILYGTHENLEHAEKIFCR
jgi:K+:H+ antiporter